jgi:hypothetical protein
MTVFLEVIPAVAFVLLIIPIAGIIGDHFRGDR